MDAVIVLYVGNFRHPWCTEVHLAASLESLGHTVERMQENEIDAGNVARRVKVGDVGLLMWTRTWGLRGDCGSLLEHLPCPSVAYHLDLYAGVKRAELVDTDPWWRARYVFTADGGSDGFWREHKVNHFWAPPGVYAEECYLAEPDPARRHPVLFVGTRRPYHEEWPWRQQLIDGLERAYGGDFAHYGLGGAVSCVRGDELNRLYAGAKVVIGDSLCLGFTHENYWSDRIPETLGRGGFLVHPRIRGLERDYREGEHFAAFDYGDLDGMRRVVGHYLDNDAKRERMRLAGHEHVKAHHTYRHRMAAMLATVAREEAKR